MKITTTDDFLRLLETSPTAGSLKFYGGGFQELECPSVSAQKSHNPQAISDSVCETLMDLDLRNRSPVIDWVVHDDREHPMASGENWIIPIQTTSTEETIITADFVERLASVMSKLWKERWKREEEEKERVRRDWPFFFNDLGIP